MIKVDKSNLTVPYVLMNDCSSPTGEKQKAIDYFEQGKGEKVEFTVYKNKEVKNVLHTLFNNKCAYCESAINFAGSLHIEHWRPKGCVTGHSAHKGYYWLASEWDNLLLACPKCNSSHKKNHFPLKNGTYAIKSTDNYKILETALLINPCETDPKEHIHFESHGFIYGLTREGEESIKIYGLDRSSLTNRRGKFENVVKGYVEDIIFIMEDLLEEIEELNTSNNISLEKKEKILRKIRKYKKGIKKKVDDLRSYNLPESEYLAMVENIFEEYENIYSGNILILTILKKVRI